jgi:hypothetical protein
LPVAVLQQETNGVIRLCLKFPETPYQTASSPPIAALNVLLHLYLYFYFFEIHFLFALFFCTPLSPVLAAWLFP